MSPRRGSWSGILALASLLVPALSQARPREITLLQALTEAEQTDARLIGADFHVAAAGEQIRAARAGYLPSLDISAIATTGNSGSFAMLGVDNNISSSERSGEGGALILKQTLWDFGRTQSGVDMARSQQELQVKQREQEKAELGLSVLETYMDCAQLKNLLGDAEFTAVQAKLIAGETDRFVRSGQRSVIERYLVDAQAKEAETLAAELTERIQVVEERLALELGRAPSEPVSCPGLDGGEGQIAVLEKKAGHNPTLDVGKARAQVALHRFEEARSEQMPLLVGVVNGGYFRSDPLKDGWNYSAGVGITLPLFAGFKLQSTTGRYRAEASATEAESDYARKFVDETNSRYDEKIRAAQVQLDFLKKEEKLANEAFDLAKKRYFSFKGTMVDLREALRNLGRVRLSTEGAKRGYLAARGARAVFNGARARE